MSLCSMTGCNRKRHAKGFCKRHYYRYRKENGLLPSQQKTSAPVQTKPVAVPQEPKKPRTDTGNYSFFLNQKFIEKIFLELIKIYDKPLYQANNGKHVEHYLNLCIFLAGYDGEKGSAFYYSLMEELRTWAESGDRIRFMEALGNWKKRADLFSQPQNVQQLSLFKQN